MKFYDRMNRGRRRARWHKSVPGPLAVAMALLLGSGAVLATTPELSDRAITDTVESELLMDPAVQLNNIDVETYAGVVTLTGTVNNLLARERAERVARTVKGVRSVVNNTSVLATERTDAAIRGDVERALLEDPVTEFYEIVTAVKDGVVTLTGHVDSWQEKQAAGRVGKSVHGVKDVVNAVQFDITRKRADSEIAAEIEKSLRWDVLVDHALIDVSVKDGNVVLSGTVGSAAEKEEARLNAWVAGVRSVDTSGLDVARWARDEALRKDKYVVKSDEEIRRAVMDAFVYDPRVLSFNVTPHVESGVVTLRGTVDNVEAKRAAAEDARNTVGVLQVKNRIRVRPERAMKDTDIEQRVEQALTRDPFVERYEISVDVVVGIAYLSGMVDSHFERAQADHVAASVNGVVAVENNLRVEDFHQPYVYNPYVDDWYIYDFGWYGYQPTVTMKSDREIRDDIESELWWSPFVDADQVNVTVNDGTATLTGTVDSWAERAAARENAFEGGAVKVVNELAVAF